MCVCVCLRLCVSVCVCLQSSELALKKLQHYGGVINDTPRPQFIVRTCARGVDALDFVPAQDPANVVDVVRGAIADDVPAPLQQEGAGGHGMVAKEDGGRQRGADGTRGVHLVIEREVGGVETPLKPAAEEDAVAAGRVEQGSDFGRGFVHWLLAGRTTRRVIK